MREFIQDIIDDPREYLPMLFILTGLLVVWSGLCVSALASLRATFRNQTGQRRQFWLALIPLCAGLLGVWTQMPFSMERQSFRLSFDFRWLFLLPLLLGAAALTFWWRARQRHDPVA